MAEGIMVDLWRDFWIRETETGQQVAQLHERYMKIINIINIYPPYNIPNKGLIEEWYEEENVGVIALLPIPV